MFPKSGMGGIYKKAQQMQKKMADVQSEIDSMEVEGISGGDMVKASISGRKKILSINLNPDILKEDKEMVEDLIVVAINQAIEKVDKISKDLHIDEGLAPYLQHMLVDVPIEASKKLPFIDDETYEYLSEPYPY